MIPQNLTIVNRYGAWAASKLKVSVISIQEDYTTRVRDIRRNLLPFLKEAKTAKKKAKLTFDKLVIDSQVYRWDEGTKRPVAMETAYIGCWSKP